MALYHFDEGEGDILTDSSGNNHHGKIVGAKWVHLDGKPLKPTPEMSATDETENPAADLSEPLPEESDSEPPADVPSENEDN